MKLKPSNWYSQVEKGVEVWVICTGRGRVLRLLNFYNSRPGLKNLKFKYPRLVLQQYPIIIRKKFYYCYCNFGNSKYTYLVWSLACLLAGGNYRKNQYMSRHLPSQCIYIIKGWPGLTFHSYKLLTDKGCWLISSKIHRSRTEPAGDFVSWGAPGLERKGCAASGSLAVENEDMSL